MKTRRVPCPVCGQPAPFDASNPFRPFCCERCKLIDLGQWATEAYRVPGAAISPHDATPVPQDASKP